MEGVTAIANYQGNHFSATIFFQILQWNLLNSMKFHGTIISDKIRVLPYFTWCPKTPVTFLFNLPIFPQ